MFAKYDKIHKENYFLCSYCYAVYEILSSKESLSKEDREAYKKHLIEIHKLEPYSIER